MKQLPWWYLSLLIVPAAIVTWWLDSGPVVVFAVSGVGLIPLAVLLGKATDALAVKLGSGLGGFLNATFGNAAELILSSLALRRGLFTVVKASLTGSIIGNALLVLGMSLLVGGFAL